MIDCNELEDMIEQWYHLNRIPKPLSDPASFVSYKSLIAFSKRDLLKKIKKFFEDVKIENVKIEDVVISETHNKHEKHIKILSKL